MSSFRGRMMAAFGIIAIVFVAMIGYALRVAPQMSRDSKIALDTFYSKCRARDYSGARALFSSNSSISAAQLRGEWQNFATKNGDFARWEAADKVSIQGFGGSVCLFPPFVDFRHAAFGKNGTGTLIYTRMVPENGAWRVERFNVLRARGLK